MADQVRDMGKLELARMLRAGEPVTVVDVRDLDRAGGHVKGSLHIPAAQFKEKAEKYAQEWPPGGKVVFYCMYSQIRGPTSARALAQAAADLKLENPPVAYILTGGFRSMSSQAQYKDIMEGFVEMT